MKNVDACLRERVLAHLQHYGFRTTPLMIGYAEKEECRTIQNLIRMERLRAKREFIEKNIELAMKYCRNGHEINPNNISLTLREVKPNSEDEILFRWWNLVWWSIPYQPAFGRQMRFLLWDKGHDTPFGLVSLQSPILRMEVRDSYLGINPSNIDSIINMSMNAQRLGALPPFNDLLGGKMVAMALISDEIREAYRDKYNGRRTLIKRRILPADLLFTTTTSAFGRSSIYNRLKINDRIVALSLGYTKGAGSFHISDELFQDMLGYLVSKGVDISRHLGQGTSRRIQLLRKCFQYLDLKNYEYHGIKREVFLFSNIENIVEVIKHGKKPKWCTFPLQELNSYWLKRWCIPRNERIGRWKEFQKERLMGIIKNNVLKKTTEFGKVA